MKTMEMVVIMMLYSGLALAQELPRDGGNTVDWLCSEEASQRRGNTILSCGVASGADENEARSKAFDNAKAEFGRVCHNSSDCRGHLVRLNPTRTVCRYGAAMDFKCYRLVAFEIGDIDPNPMPQAEPQVLVAATEQPKVDSPQRNAGGNPKVKVGMTKQQVLASLGTPDSVAEGSGYFDDNDDNLKHEVVFVYSGTYCAYDRVCLVTLKNSLVERSSDFKLIYTDALD